MLSNDEQRCLTEIEAGLRTDDPGFAQRIKEGARHRPARWWHVAAALLGTSVAVTAGGFGLVLGSVATVIAASAALCVGTAMWVVRQRRE